MLPDLVHHHVQHKNNYVYFKMNELRIVCFVELWHKLCLFGNVIDIFRTVFTIIMANLSFDRLRTNGIGIAIAKVISCALLKQCDNAAKWAS